MSNLAEVARLAGLIGSAKLNDLDSKSYRRYLLAIFRNGLLPRNLVACSTLDTEPHRFGTLMGHYFAAQHLCTTAGRIRSCPRGKRPCHMPGVLLISDLIHTFLQQVGRPDRPVRFNGKGTFDESRFLNPTTFADFDWDSAQAVIATLRPRELYRVPIKNVWESGFIPTYNGNRFGIYEHGYTTWNSVLNFYDINQGRPENFQRVRILDSLSASTLAEFEWDPRPHLVRPALSPSGRRLARVRGGALEVLSVDR